MDVIHKVCAVSEEDVVSLELPKDAKILAIQVQNRLPQMWYRFDKDQKEIVQRKFAWYGTGQDIDTSLDHKYIGTVQMPPLVFHLYEIEN